MAPHNPGSQDAEADAQSVTLQDSTNPQLLSSEMAKAFQELARGEGAASALESKLDNIEGRIEQLLASIEGHASPNEQRKSPSSDTSKPK